MAQKLKVGVVGATGMVGQRFVSLLENHPWFDVVLVAASTRSAGMTYAAAVEGRWSMSTPVPARLREMVVVDASRTADIAAAVDFIFCAVDMPKPETLALEEAFARAETPVVSNNSAARPLPDVPMLIPEINFNHLAALTAQKKRLGTKRGFIVVKPNCSIQSYVPAIHPLLVFEPTEVLACTYQAISGAGKTFSSWPEMADNIIPFIKGEEEKSETEPLKIWGEVRDGLIVNADTPRITTQCLRVPVTDGHMAAVFVSFKKNPSRQEIIDRWRTFQSRPAALTLPSAPVPFLTYHEDESRPQTKFDRDAGNGMAVSIGRLRPDKIFNWKFVCLSHNTVRGAAGGAILIAELLKAEGLLSPR